MDKEKKITIDENDEIVTLTFDDDVQEDFYCMAELDYKGKWYAYLQPVEEMEDFDDDEVLIYEIGEDENGEELFLPIEDDALLNELIDHLNDTLDEMEEEE